MHSLISSVAPSPFPPSLACCSHRPSLTVPAPDFDDRKVLFLLRERPKSASWALKDGKRETERAPAEMVNEHKLGRISLLRLKITSAPSKCTKEATNRDRMMWSLRHGGMQCAITVIARSSRPCIKLYFIFCPTSNLQEPLTEASPHLDREVLVHQEVGRLEVSVHDHRIAVVQVVDAAGLQGVACTVQCRQSKNVQTNTFGDAEIVTAYLHDHAR